MAKVTITSEPLVTLKLTETEARFIAGLVYLCDLPPDDDTDSDLYDALAAAGIDPAWLEVSHLDSVCVRHVPVQYRGTGDE